MNSIIYLDESGDLGWTFSKPYRNGGSSRYLTIGYLMCPAKLSHIPDRLVRDFYNHFGFNPKKEIKASALKPKHKEFICQQAIAMLNKCPDFHLGAITVKKENVKASIRKDGNKLYNYMIGLSAIEIVEDHDNCTLTRDHRSVKVVNGQSCIDYLQTIVWLHKNKPLILRDNPCHSHTQDGIIFIDWITNIVWSKYEDRKSQWCDLLGKMMNEKKLFF